MSFVQIITFVRHYVCKKINVGRTRKYYSFYMKKIIDILALLKCS